MRISARTFWVVPPASILLPGGLSKEIGRNQAALSVQLAHVEAVLVRLPVHVDDVTRTERQLHLRHNNALLGKHHTTNFPPAV